MSACVILSGTVFAIGSSWGLMGWDGVVLFFFRRFCGVERVRTTWICSSFGRSRVFYSPLVPLATDAFTI